MSIPPDLLPYAERLFARFPQVLSLLGDPQLPHAFHAPPCGGSTVHIQDTQGQRRVKVVLQPVNVFRDTAWSAAGWKVQTQDFPDVTPGDSYIQLPAVHHAVSDCVHFAEPASVNSDASFLGTLGQSDQCCAGRSNHDCSDDINQRLSIRDDMTRRLVPNREPGDSSPVHSTGACATGVVSHGCANFPVPSNDVHKHLFNADPTNPRDLALRRRASSSGSATPPNSLKNSPRRKKASARGSRQNPESPKRYGSRQNPESPKRNGSRQNPDSPKRSCLKQRRGFQHLNINSVPGDAPISEVSTSNKKSAVSRGRCSGDDSDASSASSSFESYQSPVILLPKNRRQGAAEDGVQLPGAFTNHRTVFIFDWDDTLCPTSWIRSVLKEQIADLKNWAGYETCVEWNDKIPEWFHHPLPDGAMDVIEDLKRAVIDCICMAQRYGVVCIVTNSLPGWVDSTMKKWLPELTPYIYGHGLRPSIRVLYGQYFRWRRSEALPWVEPLDEYMYWKKDAMTIALDDVDMLYRMDDPKLNLSDEALPQVSWCASSKRKRLVHVVSIGDDEAEMRAAELACWDFENYRSNLQSKPRGKNESRLPASVQKSSGWQQRVQGLYTCHEAHIEPLRQRRPWVTCVKLKHCPHVVRLTEQLQELTKILPQLVSSRRNSRLSLELSAEEALCPSTSQSPASSLQRLLPQVDKGEFLTSQALRRQEV